MNPKPSIQVGKTPAPAAAAVLCAFFVYFPLTNSDIFWHLTAGREMLSNGALFRTDPFSFTPLAAHWINLHWLFQLAAYQTFALWGFGGIVTAKCALVALSAALLVLFNKNTKGMVLTAGILALLVFEARYLVLARPIVITLVAIAVFLILLERTELLGKRLSIGLLVLVQILWTNSQGLFILGPFLVGVYLAEALLACLTNKFGPGEGARRSVRWAATSFFGVVAATALNPYGLKGMLFPFRLFARIEPESGNIFSRAISENVPLFHLGPADARLVAIVIAVAVLAVIGFVVSGNRPRLSHILIFSGFAFLAFSAKRNVLLFFWVCAPLIGASLSGAIERIASPRAQKQAVSIAGLVLALLLVQSAVAHAQVVATYPRANALSPFRYPQGAVDYLNAHPVQGKMFNTDRFGGYILWEMFPPTQVYIDGRFVLRSASFFREYLSILEEPSLFFEPAADKYGITHAIVHTAIFPHYLPVAEYLYRSEKWTLEFIDGTSAVFVRDTLARKSIDLGNQSVVDSIQRLLELRWGKDESIKTEALRNLSGLLYRFGHTVQAERVFSRIAHQQ